MTAGGREDQQPVWCWGPGRRGQGPHGGRGCDPAARPKRTGLPRPAAPPTGTQLNNAVAAATNRRPAVALRHAMHARQRFALVRPAMSSWGRWRRARSPPPRARIDGRRSSLMAGHDAPPVAAADHRQASPRAGGHGPPPCVQLLGGVRCGRVGVSPLCFLPAVSGQCPCFFLSFHSHDEKMK